LLFGLYLLSWLVDLTPYVINIPYLTIYKLHLWRPFLSPFYTDGLLSVVFLCLSLGGMGATLEQVRKGGRGVRGREEREVPLDYSFFYSSEVLSIRYLPLTLLPSLPPPSV